MDPPGHFPLGSPLHYAVFMDRSDCVHALTTILGMRLSEIGSEGELPITCAVSSLSISAVEELVSLDALGDNHLLDHNPMGMLGRTLSFDTWTAAARANCQGSNIHAKCVDLILNTRLDLIDRPDEEGFTPLMQATEAHSCLLVKLLLERNCNANAQTTYDNDGRTALNLITENELHYGSDDIIELLQAAGADFSVRSSKGGKLPLHFAS